MEGVTKRDDEIIADHRSWPSLGGYTLANAGQDTKAIRDYLGHRNIQNTQLYTQLSPARFARFWRD
jgi:site-specific recombinase XerC